MNCCAGLALMKTAPSDRPKTNNMKTVQTHFNAEFNMKSTLFRELFLIQLELEKHTDEGIYYHKEVKELMERMDRLMEVLIEDPT